ncbi:hydroxymethylbilane synthase [Emcibacter nanhaiensis]|uniref:hydroxymethylbilane synthase n=1 Tax=Emcibacter nanhaiensis TaxID=1505037 RepID=UPI001C611428|nr:hydroxymethylbilane synthase [Emcibacter nanhaiensis]
MQQKLGEKNIRIGTRGSQLALAQAHETKERLLAAHPDLREEQIEIVVMSTKGDRILDRPLAEIGGKGLFTEEIETALLAGDLDLAVHSLKDMPTELPDGLELAAYLEREDERDAFISAKANSLSDLPAGSVVGTASLRRQAQTLALRPDLKVITFRGNVQSRLRKLEAGEVDATYLAMAGLNRLALEDERVHALAIDELLPAVAQGAICIEIASDNAHARALVAPLNHAPTEQRVVAERAFLNELDGSCRTPIAGLATLDGDRLHLQGRLLDLDGTEMYEDSLDGPASEAERIGRELGRKLKAAAGPAFFDKLKAAGGA